MNCIAVDATDGPSDLNLVVMRDAIGLTDDYFIEMERITGTHRGRIMEGLERLEDVGAMLFGVGGDKGIYWRPGDGHLKTRTLTEESLSLLSEALDDLGPGFVDLLTGKFDS